MDMNLIPLLGSLVYFVLTFFDLFAAYGSFSLAEVFADKLLSWYCFNYVVFCLFYFSNKF